MSFVNVYLWRGVLYSDEGHFDSQQLAEFEQGVLAMYSGYVRSGRFLQFQPERLATYVVFKARKARGVEGWRDELIKLTELSTKDVLQLVEEIQPIDIPPANVLVAQSPNTQTRNELVLQKKLNIVESRALR